MRRGKTLNRVVTVLTIALTVNFLLYSSERYVPPKSHSISYSVMNCPNHMPGHGIIPIILFFTNNNSKQGPEKDCFCYSCTIEKEPSDTLVPHTYSLQHHELPVVIPHDFEFKLSASKSPVSQRAPPISS